MALLNLSQSVHYLQFDTRILKSDVINLNHHWLAAHGISQTYNFHFNKKEKKKNEKKEKENTN